MLCGSKTPFEEEVFLYSLLLEGSCVSMLGKLVGLDASFTRAVMQYCLQ